MTNTLIIRLDGRANSLIIDAPQTTLDVIKSYFTRRFLTATYSPRDLTAILSTLEELGWELASTSCAVYTDTRNNGFIVYQNEVYVMRKSKEHREMVGGSGSVFTVAYRDEPEKEGK